MAARALVATRSRARDVIRRGLVKVSGHVVSKAGKMVASDEAIDLPEDARWSVSRGGVKLAAALEAFGLSPNGCICLDVGASTGGFTQLLLQHGAAKVYAVDVGHGQLHASLRDDRRVVLLEKTDARDLRRELVKEPVMALVADVSFISLTQALAAPMALCAAGCWLVALIKPQFEVGRDGLGKGGVVRDGAKREGAVDKIRDWFGRQAGWQVSGVMPSPLTGGSGNAEFLIGVIHQPLPEEGADNAG